MEKTNLWLPRGKEGEINWEIGIDIYILLYTEQSFPAGSDGKESTCNAGSIPGSGRSLGEGNGYPLQYSSLENSMDRRAGLQRVGHN